MLATSFPHDAARPLGKGYREIMEMVLSYAAPGKTAGNPTLANSLDCVRLIPDINKYFASLVPSPHCLIQGYSTPRNADALADFIREMNGSLGVIEAIDLYDLPHLYEILGFQKPCMQYHIADAANLAHLYPRDAIDLIVQDFLLNCIPASKHEAVLREASRILKPGGLAIISFTSSEMLDVASIISTKQLKAEYDLTWDTQAYDLDGLAKRNASAKSLDHLTGKLLYHAETSEFIYVAATGGRFEFFRSRQRMLSLFKKCGLKLMATDKSEGTDDHGLACVRYRCILAK